MPRIVYVNGAFMPYEDAKIPIMDRGFLFGDGIYEVSAVLGSRLVDNEAHLARLDRSLGEIRIANPYSAADQALTMPSSKRAYMHFFGRALRLARVAPCAVHEHQHRDTA